MIFFYLPSTLSFSFFIIIDEVENKKKTMKFWIRQLDKGWSDEFLCSKGLFLTGCRGHVSPQPSCSVSVLQEYFSNSHSIHKVSFDGIDFSAKHEPRIWIIICVCHVNGRTHDHNLPSKETTMAFLESQVCLNFALKLWSP